MSPVDGPEPSRLFEIFLQLVKIDSESGEEAAVASFVRDFCGRLGLPVEEDGAGQVTGGDSGNLLIRVPASSFSNSPPVILSAHMDTVAPGKNVVPVETADRFMSGTDTVLGADCKAGMAVILSVMEAILDGGGLYAAMEVVLTVQEELGLVGAKNLDGSLLHGRWGLVLDGMGPVGGIVAEAPSRYFLVFTIHGRSAHAGVEPEKGINAIACAAQAINGLRLGRLDEETTANIGLINGGRAANVVPDMVVVEGELRSTSDDKLEKEKRKIIEVFQTAAGECGCQIEIAEELSFSSFGIDPGSEGAILLAKAMRDCGVEPNFVSTGGGSDANIFNQDNLAMMTVNVGMVGAHSKDEYILKEDLSTVARILTRLIRLAAGAEH